MNYAEAMFEVARKKAEKATDEANACLKTLEYSKIMENLHFYNHEKREGHSHDDAVIDRYELILSTCDIDIAEIYSKVPIGTYPSRVSECFRSI